MIRDVEYLQSRLGKMDGFEGVGEYLIDIIKSKVVKSKTTVPTPPVAAAQAQVASGSVEGSDRSSPSGSPPPPQATTPPGQEGGEKNNSEEERTSTGGYESAAKRSSGEGAQGAAVTAANCQWSG